MRLRARNAHRGCGFVDRVFADSGKEKTMRGGLLWLLGIPIPIIILLYLFHVI